ncbi:MAG: sigma 54-interacting transcriptional regulator [Planctomycetia bacterium]|nr:sigma 54-interacting transcriptional regulator [Planctomycetia bacterium]
MALRTIATDLLRLLDAAIAPVYVLDEERRIVFVNEACAAWAGCPASDLVGQECRYHSNPEEGANAAIAAALSPPAEAWFGRRVSAVVALADASGGTVARRVEFVPLAAGELDTAGVIAFADAVPRDEQTESEEPDEELSADELHGRLRQWRRRLASRHSMDRLLGGSAAMKLVRSQVELAATSAASVSIIGPPGSGRQHVARAVHYGRAGEAAGNLVPLACPLLGASMLESTLRALVRASAGAETARPATLLLGDVDQLSAELQSQLVRLLPVGRAIRVVSTAREPLAALAARGAFDAELAMALATVEIRLPALAERLADLPLLAQLFVEEQNREGAKQVSGLTPEALDRLAAYSWPSNVDELAEVIAAAHAQAEGPRIVPADLPGKIQIAIDAAARPRRADETIVLEQFLARIEEELIRRALARAKGNKTKAARLLGMTRPRLYRRLVQLGLEEAAE